MGTAKKVWGLLNWLGKRNTQAKRNYARRLLLETLESREVPAVVTTLLDGTNPSSPIPGSLRAALLTSKAGETITFDSALFSAGPQTLTLNGAAGAITVNQYDLTLQGPYNQSTGEYLLKLQAGLGFENIQILSGGDGYRVGDFLQQGTRYVNGTPLEGAARFMVTAIEDGAVKDGLGAITQVDIVNPGANSAPITLTATGTDNAQLTLLDPNRTPTRPAEFKAGTSNLNLASGIFVTQITPTTGTNTKTITLDGIHFGDAKNEAILQNLGNLTITNSRFDGRIAGTTPYFINTSVGNNISNPNGGGSLTISKSKFDSNPNQVTTPTGRPGTQIYYNGYGPLEINQNEFTGATNRSILTNMDTGTSSALTVNNSYFHDGNNGIYTNATTNFINGSAFQNIQGGAVIADMQTPGSSLGISDSLFEGNSGVNSANFPNNFRGPAVNFNAYSGGQTVQGSGAVFAFGGEASITVTNSVFRNNLLQKVTLPNSGGAAIFSYDSQLTIEKSPFENNQVTITGNGTENSGGGAIWSGNTTTIKDSYFTKNIVTATNDLTPAANTFGGGGALLISGADSSAFRNVTLTENQAVFSLPSGSTATGQGLTGGAILLNNSTNTTIYNSTISDNALINTAAIGLTIAGNTNASLTGGLHSNGGSTEVMNSILLQNTGIVFTPASSTSSSLLGGQAGYTNTSGTNFIYGTWDGGPSGYNIYNYAYGPFNPTFTTRYGYTNPYQTFGAVGNNRANGDLTSVTFGPIFDGKGLQDNGGVSAGLTGPDQSFSTSSFSLGNTGAKATITVSWTAGEATPNYSAGDPIFLAHDRGTYQQGTVDKFDPNTGTLSFMQNSYQTAAGTGPFSRWVVSKYSPNLTPLPVYKTNSVAGTSSNTGEMVLKTMALDRLSPARDSGFNLNDQAPGPIPFDARTYVNRKINLAVDMGAYEVQTAVRTTYAALLSKTPLALGPVGSTKTATLPKNLILQTGDPLNLQTVGENTTSTMDARVETYNPSTGIATFKITSFTGISGKTYSNWNVLLPNSVLNPIQTEYSTPFNLPITIQQDDTVTQTARISGTVYLTSLDETVIYGQANLATTQLTNRTWIGNADISLNGAAPFLPPGKNQYKVIYSGDTNYAPNTSQITIDIKPVTTLTTLSNGVPDPSEPGTLVNFTGSVANNLGSAEADGVVQLQYLSGTTWIDLSGASATLTAANAGVFSLNATFTNPTFYTVRADFRPNNALKFAASQSGSQIQEVGWKIDSIDLLPFPKTSYARNEAVTFTAQVTYAHGTPGGKVGFLTMGGSTPFAYGTLLSDSGTVATYSVTMTPTMVPSGTNQIVATYLRDPVSSTYLTSAPSAPETLTITGEPTQVLLRSTLSSASYATPITFIADISPLGGLAYNSANPGTVQFFVNSAPLGERQTVTLSGGWPDPVIFTTSSLNAGTNIITAEYSGDDANYLGSPLSNPVSVVIAKAATPMNLSFVGAVNGTTYTSRIPTNLPILVSAAMSPTAPAPVPSGETVTFRMIPNSGAPIVMGTGTLATSGVATISSPYTFTSIGSFSVEAVYGGNSNYDSSTASTLVNVFDRVQSTTTLTASPSSGTIGYGDPITFTAQVTPSGGPPYAGGTMDFYNGSTKLYSQALPVDANGWPLPVTYTTSSLVPGSYNITARYSGDNLNYLPSSSTALPLTVTKANTTLGVSATPNPVQLGKPITLTARLNSPSQNPVPLPGGQLELWLNGAKLPAYSQTVTATSLPFVTTFTVTPPNIGTLTYEVKYSGDTNYDSSIGAVNVTVSREPIEKFYLVAPQEGSFVQVFNRETNQQVNAFQPLGNNYTGGFTLAKGDVNGDGVYDMVYAPTQGGQVTILNGLDYSPIAQANPFGLNFPAALSLAVGDINGDGYGDLLVAPGSVGLPPHVLALSGKNLNITLFSQYAYETQFLGGVSVAAGDTNGDGFNDVITAPLRGAAPHIVSFSGRDGAVLQSYYAYAPQYLGGVSIAADDLNHDGYAEIITAASASAPHVVIVDSKLAMANPNAPAQFVKFSQYVYSPNFGGGVRVTTVGDINGDNVDDVVVAPGPGAAPNVVRFSGAKALQNNLQVLDSFFAYGSGDASTNYYGGTLLG